MAGKSTFIAVPPDVANNPQSLARFLYTLVEKLDVAFGNRGNGGFATPQQALDYARTQAGQAENESIAAGSAAAQAALNLAKIYTDDEVADSAASTLASANSYTDTEVAALSEISTWTPIVSFGGADTGITYTTQVGSYYKVGSLVLASCFVELSAKGSATGAMTVEGLPYSAKNTTDLYFVGGCIMDNAASAIEQPLALLDYNTSSIQIVSGSDASAVAALDDTDATATTILNITISYETD